MNYRLFAVCVPGLEPFTQQELMALRTPNLGAALSISAQPPQTSLPSGELREESGGVEFEASLADLYRANLHLRSATRILARFGEFYAAAFSELRKKAARLPWEQYLHPGQPVALRVTCHKSKLYHSSAVAERIVGAIADRLGQPAALVKLDPFSPGAESPGAVAAPLPQLVVVRLVLDQVTISIDTSGADLHRRGYRLETAKAPLRETLAAGLLLAAGWDTASPLLDPFCGSGTIPIEAALLARRIAPGKQRSFAFMDWPGFDSRLWQSTLAAAAADEQPNPAPILASDRDAGAIRMAQANADRAGVLENIQFNCQAFSAIQPPSGPGWMVTNPPYGVRVSPQERGAKRDPQERGAKRDPTHDLRNLYTRLGDVLRSLCPGWQAGILCSSDILVGHTRLHFERTLPLVNGGIPVRFYLGQVS
jgi:putative N6-adenine-specific DNA methylase